MNTGMTTQNQSMETRLKYATKIQKASYFI